MDSKINNRHKVFISYHHENDQWYRNKFENLFSNQFDIMVSKSVQIGDIDPNNNTEYVRQQIRDNYIADATVIIVLIGRETWKRKHVDWEIYSGLKDTKNNPRCGLLGIFLPTHPDYGKNFSPYIIPPRLYYNWNEENFNRYTIPPRLYDNWQENNQGYANLYNWNTNPNTVSDWIHDAFKKRDTITPVNKPPMFGKN